MDRKIESIGLCENVKCANCNGPVHVPGLVQRLVCPHCAHKVNADWHAVERDIVQVAGQAMSRSLDYKFYGSKSKTEGRLAVRRARPCCPECKSEVDLSRLDPEVTSAPCAGGHAVSVRPAEQMAHQLVPGACWIVGEGLVIEAGAQTERDLLLIHCKACGGELEIQPSKRDVPCGYCSSLNVVPDELWLRLHPELQPREFFVVAAWGDEDFEAQVAALRLWHERSPKKRQPLYKDEIALCRDWPSPPTSGLDWLVRTLITEERVALAGEKNLPPGLIQKLAADPKVPVRERLAESPRLPPDIQALLARDPNANVVRRIAEREDLDPAVAEVLIATGDPKVIERVESRGATSVGVRLALARAGRNGPLLALEPEEVSPEELPLLAAHEPDVEARVLAARHPGAAPELLARLAADPAVEVRRAVAVRKALSPDAVEALFRDPDKRVRKAIRTRSDLPESLQLEVARKDPQVLEAMLRREDCPAEAFELAVTSDWKKAHRLLAAHPATPELILVALAEKADDDVASALVSRDRTPLLRGAMAASPSARLRREVCFDPLDPAQLEALTRDPDPGVRRRIASRPDLPPALALVLASDPVPDIQAAVVAHPAVRAHRLRRRLLIGAGALVVIAVVGCAGLIAAASAGVATSWSALFG